METEILNKTYYYNTVESWLLSLLIVFASVILGKALYLVFSNVIKKAASKSKTKFDDILVDMIEEPIVFSVIIAGLWIGVKKLVFTPSIEIFIDNIFQVLIVINVAWLISRLFDSLFKEYVVPLAGKTESDLDDQLMPILRKGTKGIIWIIAIIVSLNNAGYDVAALLAGFGIGGLAFAMAAKDMISNIFGGFTIFSDKPFKINDRIKIDGYDGIVTEIGVRTTRLRTLDGRTVTLPNSKFLDSAIENVSSEPNRKVVLNLGLTYDMNSDKIRQAIDILKDIAKQNDAVEDNCLISFNEFDDFTLNVFYAYYIKKESDILETMTHMNLSILDRFNAGGLEFAFPTQTIFTKTG